MSIFDFAEGVTMHGFNHVFVKDQKTVRTVVWSICFLGSVALFILQVSATV